MTRAARVRLVSVLALLVLNAAVLLAWSQPWLAVRSEGASFAVAGSVAGGAELPLALTGLLLVAALLIAGRVFRVVLPVLQSLLGLCVAIAAGLVLGDPVGAARGEVTRETAISGDGSDIVATATLWPAVALVLGLLLVLAGLAVAVTVRLWPRPTSRFQRTRTTPADGADPDPVEEWDALSDGEDPTGPPDPAR